MPGEIEFLDNDGDEPDRPEERLEHGPRQRWPRWAIAVGTLVSAGVIAVAITTHGDTRPQAGPTTAPAPTAAPSGQASVVPPPASTPPAPTLSVSNPGLAAAIGHVIPGQPGIQAIAIVGDHVVVLAPGYLARISHSGDGSLYRDGGSNVGLPIGDPTYADWKLIPDGGNLWTVGGGRVYQVDPSTMRLGPLLNSPGGFTGAAALDGHLYLNTDVGVYQVAPSAPSLSKQTLTRGGRAMAVDPTRHRLLLLDHDSGWSIRVYSLRTHKTVASRALTFNARSLVVANGAIWVTGTSGDADGKPVLTRLDPTTLRVIDRSKLGPQLPAVPTLVAGQSDLWVRSGSQLWCVNAGTGAVAQHWSSLPGQIASQKGRIFVADGDVVGRLRLDSACTG